MAPGYREIEIYFTKNPKQSFPVGTLAEKENSIYFEYHQEWLDSGLELSPFTLPCKPGLIKHSNHRFGPLFGLFDDSLPDGWGLLLMDRFFRNQGTDLVKVSVLDRLLYLGRDTMGALTYHPPSGNKEDTENQIDLHRLSEEAKDVFEGKAKDILPELTKAGGSPGGARPKILVGYNRTNDVILSGEGDLGEDFEHWIIKFSARKDSSDAGPVEYAYSLMAHEAGIEMEQTKLFETAEGDRFFGVKRFDRSPNNVRHHIHTFGNLIQANFRIPSCDYGDLLKVVNLLTKDHVQLKKAYRLMCFNVLANNRDDHAKNFSFRLDDESGQWHLAPAYDLTFSRGPGGEHTTTVSGEGRQPTVHHCLQLAEEAGISLKEAQYIYSNVKDAVSCWLNFADQVGVREEVSNGIESFLEKSISSQSRNLSSKG